MKVLIVTHHYLQGHGGGVFATRGFINAVSALYEDVTLLCPVMTGRKPEHISPKVRIVEVEDRRPVLKKAFDLLLGCFHRYGKAFPKLIAEERFDLIIFDNSYVSGGLIDSAIEHCHKVVTIHHNWQYEYEKDNATGLLRPLRLYYAPRIEREAVLKSTVNITLTEQDKEAFYREYDPERKSRIVVCPPFEYE